ncbi:DUF4199 domain-containing protein [Mucilaginibacter myungsuensis]|uniref:DUF4199 domain-containing protein n=1 Tax=Mucilaginibacter myungsuensis TaxID=649104 RepID=A0A929L3U2_9SPHI|nr:DUF4199 domain-containing protein [Mucilaginibacter myungsuensis]MBE9663974.1 DUF4199 domain-containing protein [Mucilaginibacter myungsuensis]MDN3601153.1 DUF4199 domain-containing protein [Mucilaginibacter myungsuensis]
MKRNVWVFGGISAVLLTIWLIIGIGFCYNGTAPDYEGSMVMGYASMVLAFSLVFVGVKNYRDKFNGGVVTFGKAFTMALYMVLIASATYVIVWLIEYYFFIPDFMDKYTTHCIARIKSSSDTAAEQATAIADINNMKELYKSPIMVVLFTFMEVFPVGLVVALITAAILQRKTPKTDSTLAA